MPEPSTASTAPKISVLIPSFNQARFLVKTLATVGKQEYPATEVIIADAASTDHTRQVVEAYGPLVTRFICEPDRGQLDGLSKAIAAASGDILYWLNADDAVMPGAFQRVAAAFADDPATDIVFSDDYAFDEETRILNVGATIRGMSFWDHFLFYRQMYSECVYWRRGITDQGLPLDHSLRVYSDYSFFLPLCYGRSCRWLPVRLGAFRSHAGQQSDRHRERGDMERELVKQRMRERLGMTEAEFRRRQRAHRLSFFIRQQFYPKAQSALRYLGRRLTADRARRRLARFFYEQWLQPPPHVLQQLGAAMPSP